MEKLENADFGAKTRIWVRFWCENAGFGAENADFGVKNADFGAQQPRI